MSSYYGVIRANESDSLQHYGIKGMRWGVRKAIASGNEKKLSKQYQKASKKLAKLTAKADASVQQAKADKYNKVSKISRRIGHVGLGASVAGQLLRNPIQNKMKRILGSQQGVQNYYNDIIVKERAKKAATKAADWENWRNGDYKTFGISKNESAKRINNFHKEITDKYGDDIKAQQYKASSDAMHHKDMQNLRNAQKARATASNIAAGVGALGYGVAIGSKIKAHAAKKRTTSEGHAKAVQELNAWKKQMNEAFKGTRYAKSPSVNSKISNTSKKRKRR